jgi:hypothetical protein
VGHALTVCITNPRRVSWRTSSVRACCCPGTVLDGQTVRVELGVLRGAIHKRAAERFCGRCAAASRRYIARRCEPDAGARAA